MDAILQHLSSEQLVDWTRQTLFQSAMLNFYAFTLVLARMSGLTTIGPFFGQSVVPVNVRVLLVLTLSFLITPTLHDQTRAAFFRLDTDADGRLTSAEIPEHLHDEFEEILGRPGNFGQQSLSIDEFVFTPQIPTSLLDFAWIIITEFALGAILGLGVTTILSGLQLAGQLIDQQAGLALGEVFNPGLDLEASMTGQTLYLLGTTVLLVMEPLNGHLLIASTLMETFQSLPVGHAFVSTDSIDFLSQLVHLSLVLAVRVAAPLLATMTLVALSMGYLGHSVPQINLLVVGFPIRAIISLLILAVTITNAGQITIEAVTAVIEELRFHLTELP